MDGTFTNTQRLIQWHDRPPTRPATRAATSGSPSTSACGSSSSTRTAADAARSGLLNLTWDYIDPAENAQWQIKDEPRPAGSSRR